MINGVNEIAFNNEINVKPRESKTNKGFDKFIKKLSQNKNQVNASKESVSYKKDLLKVKNEKALETKNMDTKASELKDMDKEDSIKDTNEQLYVLIQNIFFQSIPEDLEGLLKEGKDIEELILNLVEDISKENVDLKEALDGINIKDLGLDKKVNKEEFKEMIKTFLQSPKFEKKSVEEIKTELTSLIEEKLVPLKKETLTKEKVSLKKDSTNNTIVPKENLNVKVETKKEDLTQNSTEESFSKEENSEEAVLKNILGSKEDNKFSKAVNFMNQFNKIANVENLEVENVENIVATKETLNADVIKAVKYMELNNIKNLTVKINPKELGELVIRITMESGKMKANITANNKETFNLLNANLQDITDKLQKGAVKIENFSLNLYEDTTFFSNDKEKGKEGFKGNKKNSTKVNAIENDIVEEENPIEDLSNISILA